MSEETAQLFGMKTSEQPRLDLLAAGCPATGWIHEAVAPWRVIVSTDPEKLPAFTHRREEVQLYVGDEPTVDWLVYQGESLIRARHEPYRLFADLKSAVKLLSEDRPVETRQLMDQVWQWHDAWKREQRP